MTSRPVERGVTARSVVRVRDGARTEHVDELAVEEPLEIRLAGETLAVTMRTPGDDRHLAVGFLLAEGLIASLDDLGSVAHCGRPGEEGYGNVIEAIPAPGLAVDPERILPTRRGTLTTASCGVCGRQSIDDLLERCEPLERGGVVPGDLIAAAADRLHQPNFDRTGGVHAALLLSAAGAALASAEDVGRHNAVDKVVGALLHEPPEEPASVLVVSGRVSFEIVQKAVAARVPIVVGVSAPTSLAFDLADRMVVTLVGFARGAAFNVYTHAERIG